MPSTRMLSSGLRAFNCAVPRTALSQPKPRHFSELLSLTSKPSPTPSSRLLRTTLPKLATRNNSSSSSTPPNLTNQTPNAAQDAANEEQNRLRREQEPAYQITFTCRPCGHRSSHRMSKHGYHRGTILIRCPSCLNRHVIADHLNIFMDKKSTLEDILQREGKRLTRGYVDGDMEFWEDGTVKKREGSGEGEEAKSDQ